MSQCVYKNTRGQVNTCIIHKPNAYFHTLVKNMGIINTTSQRYSPLEQHEEIVKNHVTERIEKS